METTPGDVTDDGAFVRDDAEEQATTPSAAVTTTRPRHCMTAPLGNPLGLRCPRRPRRSALATRAEVCPATAEDDAFEARFAARAGLSALSIDDEWIRGTGLFDVRDLLARLALERAIDRPADR